MGFWIGVAVVVALVAVLAVWSSGRVGGRALSAGVRAAGETEALKKYNPAGGTPGGGL